LNESCCRGELGAHLKQGQFPRPIYALQAGPISRRRRADVSAKGSVEITKPVNTAYRKPEFGRKDVRLASVLRF